jgi:hypothetical protein
MRFHANSIASLLASVSLGNALSTVQAFAIAPPLAHRSSVSFVRTVVPSSRTMPRLFGADDVEDEEEEDKPVNPDADPNYPKAKTDLTEVAKNFIKKKYSDSRVFFSSNIDQAAKDAVDYFHMWKKQQSQKVTNLEEFVVETPLNDSSMLYNYFTEEGLISLLQHMDGRKETLNECIAALELENTMESFYVNGSPKTKSHFIRLDKTIDFRHRGESKATPKNVVLVKNNDLGDMVAVFHSGSGTGKSVELAGSSFVRSTDFTLLVQLKDWVDFEKIDKGNTYVSDRNLKAWDQLKTKFESDLQDFKIRSAFRRICNADQNGPSLELVSVSTRRQSARVWSLPSFPTETKLLPRSRRPLRMLARFKQMKSRYFFRLREPAHQVEQQDQCGKTS